MDILDIIKTKRKELNMTQEQMAKLLNMPRTTYYNIEANAVTLKIYDFLKIIKILDIPLGYFTDEDYVIIPKKDFEELKKATNTISSITEKADTNFNIVNNSQVVNMTFNNKISKKKYCEICGEPSGFFPLCKRHALLKEKGLVYKDGNGHWIEI